MCSQFPADGGASEEEWGQKPRPSNFTYWSAPIRVGECLRLLHTSRASLRLQQALTLAHSPFIRAYIELGLWFWYCSRVKFPKAQFSKGGIMDVNQRATVQTGCDD
ncbi:unnamed protein product [Protopolystoma xenopodis]|uniref:Uncharacterized protein n=1 Tax=Protopolystoma xenopodis TaxID=117903 RepID=A0A448XNJ4_9PLAT|nr:unnamed protein product [Protopolystoma xenopodis]